MYKLKQCRHLRIFIIMYCNSGSFPQRVCFYEQYYALYCTLSLLQISDPCFNSKTVFFFAVLKIMKSMAITLEVCILEHDSLSRIAQRIDPHTSAKFCAFNTNYLNNAAQFF